MRVYHRTDAATEILTQGFRDSTDYYMTRNLYTGVWFSTVPLDVNEGATGEMLLALEIPDDVLADYEWREEGKGLREFLVPADVANRFGPVELVADDGF